MIYVTVFYERLALQHICGGLRAVLCAKLCSSRWIALLRAGIKNDGPVRAHRDDSSMCRYLERFQAKWIPVRVKKTRQNKKIEHGRDSIQSERALEVNLRPCGEHIVVRAEI
jgi:hypothetical protein